MRTEPRQRTIWGAVSGGTGAVVVAGSGDWTAQRTGTGAYTLRFNTPFSRPPGINVTAAGTSITVISAAPTTAQAQVATQSTAGAAADGSFYFSVTGPT